MHLRRGVDQLQHLRPAAPDLEQRRRQLPVVALRPGLPVDRPEGPVRQAQPVGVAQHLAVGQHEILRHPGRREGQPQPLGTLRRGLGQPVGDQRPRREGGPREVLALGVEPGELDRLGREIVEQAARCRRPRARAARRRCASPAPCARTSAACGATALPSIAISAASAPSKPTSITRVLSMLSRRRRTSPPAGTASVGRGMPLHRAQAAEACRRGWRPRRSMNGRNLPGLVDPPVAHRQRRGRRRTAAGCRPRRRGCRRGRGRAARPCCSAGGRRRCRCRAARTRRRSCSPGRTGGCVT